jgi:hypothetical protein
MRDLFPHNYDVEGRADLPGSGKGRLLYYPGATAEGGRDGVLVKVKPSDAPAWVGCFARGYRSAKALTEIASCPHPDELCVVSSGAAYIVRVDDPHIWRQIDCFPVTQLLQDSDSGLVLFCDFTKIVAISQAGLHWVSQRLATDWLQILRVDHGTLRVLAWRAEHNREIELDVDLATGREIHHKTQ